MIARIAGSSTKTVTRANKKLEELQLIEKLTQGYKVKRNKGVGFIGANNTYRLVNITEERIRKFLKFLGTETKTDQKGTLPSVANLKEGPTQPETNQSQGCPNPPHLRRV